MSEYLVARIEADPVIEVLTCTEVVAGEGRRAPRAADPAEQRGGHHQHR